MRRSTWESSELVASSNLQAPGIVQKASMDLTGARPGKEFEAERLCMPVEAFAQVGDEPLGYDNAQVVLTQSKQSIAYGKEDQATAEQEDEAELILWNGAINEFTDQQWRDQPYSDPQNHYQRPKREFPAIDTQVPPDLSKRA